MAVTVSSAGLPSNAAKVKPCALLKPNWFIANMPQSWLKLSAKEGVEAYSSDVSKRMDAAERILGVFVEVVGAESGVELEIGSGAATLTLYPVRLLELKKKAGSPNLRRPTPCQPRHVDRENEWKKS